MNEDFATRTWADRHAQFSKGVADAAQTVMDALAVLNAKQFDAPWRQPLPPKDCATC